MFDEQYEEDLREELADLAHQQWSGWMIYLFGKTLALGTDGSRVIPADLAERWKRQLSTRYQDLTDEEKDSDRKEADRLIRLLRVARLLKDD